MPAPRLTARLTALLLAALVGASPAGLTGRPAEATPGTVAPPPIPPRGATAPEGPRTSVALSNDPTTGETLLFGGTDGHDFDDTWIYRDHWVRQDPPVTPPGRATAAAAYLPSRHEHVMFGGLSGGIVAYGDTWVWTGGAWQQQFPTTSPPARAQAALALDGATGTLILFGGSRYLGPAFGDTWRWTGTAWEQLAPASSPPPTAAPVMASFDGTVVLFDRPTNDTWTWDATTWTRHPAAQTFVGQPTPGAGERMALGAGRLFAGGSSYDASWRWTGSAWVDYHTVPTLFDGQVAGAFGYGPFRDSGDPSATWQWDGTAWGYVDVPFVAVEPRRLLDTRPGVDQTGYLGAKPGPGDIVRLSLRGRPLPSTRTPGAPLPPDSAVLLSVTGTEPTADGYVTVWRCDEPRPVASNLNLAAGVTTAALVITDVSSDLDVCLFTQSGTHLVADLVGWVPPLAPFRGGAPFRVLDTRADTAVDWRGDRPGDGARVVVHTGLRDGTAFLNITGIGAEDGFVSVVPCDGTAPPTTSNVNLVAGAIRSNVAIVPTSEIGDVCLYTKRSADLVVDVLGLLEHRALRGGAVRILDTRPGERINANGTKPAAGEYVRVPLTAPAVPSEVGAVVLNVTATDASGAGFVTVWSCDDFLPLASTLNVTAGATASVLTVTPVGPSREVCIYTHAGTHLVVDAYGAL